MIHEARHTADSLSSTWRLNGIVPPMTQKYGLKVR
jgi:hypothetical protein